jgi:hypothetical protein
VAWVGCEQTRQVLYWVFEELSTHVDGRAG